jgi:hypothetical protein
MEIKILANEKLSYTSDITALQYKNGPAEC